MNWKKKDTLNKKAGKKTVKKMSDKEEKTERETEENEIKIKRNKEWLKERKRVEEMTFRMKNKIRNFEKLLREEGWENVEGKMDNEDKKSRKKERKRKK